MFIFLQAHLRVLILLVSFSACAFAGVINSADTKDIKIEATEKPVNKERPTTLPVHGKVTPAPEAHATRRAAAVTSKATVAQAPTTHRPQATDKPEAKATTAPTAHVTKKSVAVTFKVSEAATVASVTRKSGLITFKPNQVSKRPQATNKPKGTRRPKKFKKLVLLPLHNNKHGISKKIADKRSGRTTKGPGVRKTNAPETSKVTVRPSAKVTEKQIPTLPPIAKVTKGPEATPKPESTRAPNAKVTTQGPSAHRSTVAPTKA